jgi:hypothetical protein
LTGGLDHAALDPLDTAVFGTRILLTEQQAWSTEESLRADRGQSRAEALCRPLQEVRHRAVRPPSHWTDHTLRVPPFSCRLARRLCRLVDRARRIAGDQGRLSRLLDVCASIRLAMVLWPAESPRGPPRGGWVLEDRQPSAWHLSQPLVPPVPPLV